MSTPYLAQLQIFSFNFAPKGWALCNGQTLPINQNQALFSLLGTSYGGDGITTFKLPNLQGAFAIDTGNGFVVGQTGGEATHTLVTTELPAHTHPLVASAAAGTLPSPANGFSAVTVGEAFSNAANTTLGSGSSPSGGSQPHENMPPYNTLTVCIALQGIFPSRN